MLRLEVFDYRLTMVKQIFAKPIDCFALCKIWDKLLGWGEQSFQLPMCRNGLHYGAFPNAHFDFSRELDGSSHQSCRAALMTLSNCVLHSHSLEGGKDT